MQDVPKPPAAPEKGTQETPTPPAQDVPRQAQRRPWSLSAHPVTQPIRAAIDSATAKVRLWQETAQWSVIAFVAVVGMTAIGWTLLSLPDQDDAPGWRRKVPAAEEPAQPAEPVFRRAIDGLPVEEGAPEPDYFAVMIDNIIEAHPHSGVGKASLVIEAPVEAGITRLFALFASDTEAEKIGPVRSARPYYVDWAEEYHALYAHVGGSPEALTLLKSGDARDLNEFFAGASFWRDAARRAPHSTYTSTDLLAVAAGRRGEPKPLAPWKFKPDAPLEERGTATNTFEIEEYGQEGVGWTYDREANVFTRVVGGRPEKDDTGEPMLAKNVVVQFAAVRILDDVGRRRIDTSSGGDALVAIDGRVIGALWKKGEDGRTRFYDAAGNELSFNAGKTWIHVVPTGTVVTY